MNKIVVTVCSRQKSADPRPLPAHKRYLGSHITKVQAIAAQAGDQFYILSGYLGLVPSEDETPHYDYLLTEDGVREARGRIALQLVAGGISEIHFYTKNKSNWRFYNEALAEAAREVRAELHLHYLGDND